MRLVMTLIARDEADIIAELLAYHRNLGVDAFAIVDNGSTDETSQILEENASTGDVLVKYEPRDVSLEETMTVLARTAAIDLEADWVLASDADEFWTPRIGTLKTALGEVESGKVRAAWFHFPPRLGDEPWFERMTARLLEPQNPWFLRHSKVAFRADPSVIVAGGNHDAAVAAAGVVDGVIDVLHFPYRSPSQFKRKMLRHHSNLAPHGEVEERFELAHRDPEGTYQALVVSDRDLRRGLDRGVYVRDTRVRDVIRAGHP